MDLTSSASDKRAGFAALGKKALPLELTVLLPKIYVVSALDAAALEKTSRQGK